MEWYAAVLRKYADFSGRARRKEYWMFALISLVIGVVLALLSSYSSVAGLFSGVYSLAILVPSLAVGVRRLHDTDRSGWTLLLALIPLVGAVIVIVFLCQEGEEGGNEYGLDPKEQERALPL